MMKVKLWGGVGLKTSNNNTQWFQQDRIYDSDGLAICLSSGFNPWYKVEENEHESNRDAESSGQT